MKPKTIILAVVAVICGLGASWMTSNLLASRQQSETETVRLVLASKNLNIGESIKNPEAMFYIKDVPKDGVSPKALIVESDEMFKEKLKGRILKRPLRKDDWVDLDENTYAGNDPSGGIGVHLPVGMRAVGIRVNNETAAGGFANLPLSRVDILHSVRRGTDKETYVQVLLENVLVLAADTMHVRNEGGGAMPANVVTVAVNPEDAMRITVAKDTGNMTFVVRKVGDYTRTKLTKMTFEEVRNTDPTAPKETDNETSPLEGSESAPSPVLPPLPKADEPVVAADAPPPPPVAVAKQEPENWNHHKLVIVEGADVRTVPFKLHKATGKVVDTDVTKSPLSEEDAPAVSPTPPPVATPRPEPKPEPKPAPKQPKGRDDDTNF